MSKIGGQGSQEKEGSESKEGVEVAILKTRMDEFQREIGKKVSGCATLSDLKELAIVVEGKGNVAELNEAL